MLAWLREKVGELHLVLDIPARMVALEQENAEILGRVIEVEQELDDLEALARELLVGGAEFAELDAESGPLCDFCRAHPGQTGCIDPTCITNTHPKGGHHAA
jgi:hypothetical protein